MRKLSEELSQRDVLVQKFQKEKDHLVELSQVRVDSLYVYQSVMKQMNFYSHKFIQHTQYNQKVCGHLSSL